MKNSMIAVVLFLLLAAAVFAQADDETETLRQKINIPATDVIRKNENTKLPAGNSLKIFLAIERPGNEAEYFDKWVRQWNKKEGDKNGKLEIVRNISEADVILTQFVTTRGEFVQDSSVGIKTTPTYGSVDTDGQTNDKKIKVFGKTEYKSLNLPVYSYLIKREDTLWTIIYRDVETSIPGEQLSNPELNLWRAFKEEMKDR